MYTDSIAQYLVKKKTQKTLLLTGPLVDEKIVHLLKSLLENLELKFIKKNFS